MILLINIHIEYFVNCYKLHDLRLENLQNDMIEN